MSSKSTASNSVGCLTVIGIVFVVLKLLAIEPVASWSWIWVLCPFWIGIAFEIVFLAVVVPVMLFIVKILDRH